MNQGQNKWQFDHWEQDGLPLDRDQYGATISVGSLPIPYNGSNLVAYFRQNPNYVVPPEEKEPSSIEDMSGWLTELQNRHIPLDASVTKKTAEVYDYQNRIYRVDLTSKANFETFAGNLDMAFCLDVSNSMYFPSKLDETKTSHYNGSNPTMPIYQINNGGWGWSNKGWLDTSRDYDHPYYLIADASGTATVFKIYYKEESWRAIDASRTGEYEQDNNGNWVKRYFIIGQEDFSTNYGEDARHPFSKGDNDNSVYTIYDAGDSGYNRFHYLNQSLGNGSDDLNAISELLKVAGESSPNVYIAYNTFNKNLGSQRRDFQPAGHLQVDLSNSHGGGTRPDQAFNDAQNFTWTADYKVNNNGDLLSTDRYVILVTDGAPQGVRDGEAKNTNTEQIYTWVREAAQNLKNNSHVKLITVGLSMEDVTSGKRLLYDLADYDNDGEKMFYMAESASDLDNIFRQITKVLMEDAVVFGDITDTVGDAFYLVDKLTGLPLGPGDMIDIEGIKTTDVSKAAGTIQADGRTVLWKDQPIDSVTGWHGTVYAKAMEELLGGNAVKTNKGNATIVATKYRAGEEDVYFDTTLVRDTLNLTASLPSPKVNVNELTFFNNETEWTVYLGTEVDPKQQLRAIYDSLVVEEVINKDGNLHYTMNPNSIEERWDDATGTVATFSLPGLIEKLIKNDSALEARYFDGANLKWDIFLGDILSNGITLPYHEFGLNDGSTIKITLDKTIVQGEEGDLVNRSPHNTSVTGDAVEKYVFRIAYDPDYTVTPIGQGGQSTEDFHTGTYGSMYQGHAAGRESSTNTHVINVFAKKLEIEKVDQAAQTITSSKAEFELYRKATAEEIADSTITKVTLPGVTGSFVCIQHLETDNGIAVTDALPLLDNGESYYLRETKAPAGYDLLADVLKVDIDMNGHNTWTKISDKTTSQTKPNPYEVSNWLQEATILVNGIDGQPNGYATRVENIQYDSVNDKTDASAKYTIRNDAGVELPSAGGSGTHWIYLLGAMMALTSIVGLVARAKVKNA